MAQEMEIMMGILANLRKKYNYINRLMDETKELDRSVRSRDEVSIKMSLDMRSLTMAAVDGLDAQNRSLMKSLREDLQKKISSILSPSGETPHLSNPLEIDLYDTQQRIVGVLQRVVSLDDEIRKKTGGLEKEGR